MFGAVATKSGRAVIRLVTRMLLVTAATVVLLTAGTISPARATSTTEPQVVSPNTTLYAVACSTPTTCFAVGSIQSGPGIQGGPAIVPITNGVAGPAQRIAGVSMFTDIVCPSTTTCVAYGAYQEPGDRSNPNLPVMVVITNGVIGTPQPTPGGFMFTDVACGSASSCLGLAIISDASGVHAAVVPITNGVAGPAAAIPETVESVSDVACATSTVCYVVGQSFPDPDDFFGAQTGMLFPVVNGVPGPAQVVPGTSNLFSVACASATTCYAVGLNDSFQPVLVPIVNGVVGAPQVVSGADVLTGIACLSATTCEAVGFAYAPGGSVAVVVPIVNGTPGPAHVVTGANGLEGVACSVSRCVAIGAVNPPPPAQTVGVVVSITEPGPANANACKNGGWRSFNNPVFKNQGDCVSSVTSSRR